MNATSSHHTHTYRELRDTTSGESDDYIEKNLNFNGDHLNSVVNGNEASEYLKLEEGKIVGKGIDVGNISASSTTSSSAISNGDSAISSTSLLSSTITSDNAIQSTPPIDQLGVDNESGSESGSESASSHHHLLNDTPIDSNIDDEVSTQDMKEVISDRRVDDIRNEKIHPIHQNQLMKSQSNDNHPLKDGEIESTRNDSTLNECETNCAELSKKSFDHLEESSCDNTKHTTQKENSLKMKFKRKSSESEISILNGANEEGGEDADFEEQTVDKTCPMSIKVSDTHKADYGSTNNHVVDRDGDFFRSRSPLFLQSSSAAPLSSNRSSNLFTHSSLRSLNQNQRKQPPSHSSKNSVYHFTPTSNGTAGIVSSNPSSSTSTSYKKLTTSKFQRSPNHSTSMFASNRGVAGRKEFSKPNENSEGNTLESSSGTISSTGNTSTESTSSHEEGEDDYAEHYLREGGGRKSSSTLSNHQITHFFTDTESAHLHSLVNKVDGRNDRKTAKKYSLHSHSSFNKKNKPLAMGKGIHSAVTTPPLLSITNGCIGLGSPLNNDFHDSNHLLNTELIVNNDCNKDLDSSTDSDKFNNNSQETRGDGFRRRPPSNSNEITTHSSPLDHIRPSNVSSSSPTSDTTRHQQTVLEIPVSDSTPQQTPICTQVGLASSPPPPLDHHHRACCHCCPMNNESSRSPGSPEDGCYENSQRVIPSEPLKTLVSFIFLFAAWCATTTSLALTHERVPEVAPLPDIILDNLQYQSWGLDASEIIIIVATWIAFFLSIFHQHRFIVLRRIFFIGGIHYFYRAITMYITVLPKADPHYKCAPKLDHLTFVEIARRVLKLLSGMGLSINGQHIYCGDYIYSGHTMTLLMTYLIIKEYSPRRWFLLHWFSMLTVIVGISFLLYARGHYSIDVLIAYWITTRVWWIYHTLANNHHSLKWTSNHNKHNYLTRMWWMVIFRYFETNVAQPLPKGFSLPIPRRWTSVWAFIPTFLLNEAQKNERESRERLMGSGSGGHVENGVTTNNTTPSIRSDSRIPIETSNFMIEGQGRGRRTNSQSPLNNNSSNNDIKND